MDVVAPDARNSLGRKPLGLSWRASYWFTTLVVGSGIAIDSLVYSILTPVIPFQLERLGYTEVSGRAGWLLFAYSGGLLLSTIPVAMLSEGYNARRWPLIIGFFILIGSQIMCVARVLQGVGSSLVWVVGLALLCDATPEILIGQQLGIAMIGFSVGLVLGPPIGGALYTRFGFRGPFIFGAICGFLDFLGRLMIIERKDSLKWGHDPHNTLPNQTIGTEDKITEASAAREVSERGASAPGKALSLAAVLLKLSTSPRAVAASLISWIYGMIIGSQEPSIPVHLQDVWGLSSEKVGLIYIAAVVPTLFSTPLTGHLADKRGAEFVAFLCLILGLPWFVVMMVESRLALFIAAFGLSSFFTSGVISPATAELAAVSRNIEGLGYAHVYGAFNLAYGAGSTIGPVVGGQMYDNLAQGWQAITLMAAGLIFLGLMISFGFIGERPLFRRVWKSFNSSSSSPKSIA